MASTATHNSTAVSVPPPSTHCSCFRGAVYPEGSEKFSDTRGSCGCYLAPEFCKIVRFCPPAEKLQFKELSERCKGEVSKKIRLLAYDWLSRHHEFSGVDSRVDDEARSDERHLPSVLGAAAAADAAPLPRAARSRLARAWGPWNRPPSSSASEASSHPSMPRINFTPSPPRSAGESHSRRGRTARRRADASRVPTCRPVTRSRSTGAVPSSSTGARAKPKMSGVPEARRRIHKPSSAPRARVPAELPKRMPQGEHEFQPAAGTRASSTPSPTPSDASGGEDTRALATGPARHGLLAKLLAEPRLPAVVRSDPGPPLDSAMPRAPPGAPPPEHPEAGRGARRGVAAPAGDPAEQQRRLMASLAPRRPPSRPRSPAAAVLAFDRRPGAKPSTPRARARAKPDAETPFGPF